MTPVCRPATAEDIAAFQGCACVHTMRAWVWSIEGQSVAVAGVIFPNNGTLPLVFSRLHPDARRFPIAIARGARAFMARFTGYPVFAIADRDEPGSVRLLTWLGFEFVSVTPRGDLYRFDPRRDTAV